jgi:hypothetical protein
MKIKYTVGGVMVLILLAGHFIPTATYKTDTNAASTPTEKHFRLISGGNAKYDEAINNIHCTPTEGCGNFIYKKYLW